MRHALAKEFLHFRSTLMPSGEYEFLMFSGDLYAFAYLGEAEIMRANWNDVFLLMHHLQTVMVENLLCLLRSPEVQKEHKKNTDYIPQQRKVL